MTRQKKYVILAVSAAALLILTTAVILPMVKSINESSANLILQKKEIKIQRFKGENVSELRDTYKTLQPFLDEVDQLFIDSRVPIAFIRFIEQIAYDVQIILQLDSVSQKVAGEPWPILAFQITCFGSATDFLQFIEKIETVPDFLVKIRRLTIRKITGKSLSISEEDFSAGNIQAVLLIEVHTK